jgi:hypothetical protein
MDLILPQQLKKSTMPTREFFYERFSHLSETAILLLTRPINNQGGLSLK